MKNSRSDECEVNISVIGFSGCEKTKGVRGIGKSCLCNRLAQPNHYKSKHSSVVSSVLFDGSDNNDNQWLFWGSVSREIRGNRYLFRFIEQTIMVDDISHRPIVSKENFVERATVTELRGCKSVNIVSTKQPICSPLRDRTSVHLFLLLYDVSAVEGRDPVVQDTVFRQLFDRVISSKRALIVVSTKHDQLSSTASSRLTNLLSKRPYSKYPLVETSSALGVNIECLFELAAVLKEGGVRTQRQRFYPYDEALREHKANVEQCREELRRVAVKVLDSEMWHSHLEELRRLPMVEPWVSRLGLDLVTEAFDEVRLDVRLKRRLVSCARHRDGLLRILQLFHHLLPPITTDFKAVLETLTNDVEFMSNFIPFTLQAEYFDFNQNENLLPLYLLEPNNENSLTHLIKEYIEQRTLEENLFNLLIKDCQRNFRKSLQEIGDDLKASMNHFILDKIVSNVYERFREYYLKILECQFLDIIHENPKWFFTHGSLKRSDFRGDKNGLSRKRSTQESHHDSAVFVKNMVKEINTKITFEHLSLADDEKHQREKWLSNYFNFLNSANELDCIYSQVNNSYCHCSTVAETFPPSRVSVAVDTGSLPHMWYVLVIGDSVTKNHLSEVIISSGSKWPLDFCKVHLQKYEVQLVTCVEMLKDVINELGVQGDRCSILCVLICAQGDHLPVGDLDQVSLVERASNYKLVKYTVYEVLEELINIAPFEGSLMDAHPEPQLVHISTLLDKCKRIVEPSVVWVVTVCGDSYDYSSLLSLIIRILKLHSIPKHMNGTFVTVCGSFFSKEVENHNYRLCFIPYHQAIKMLIRSSPPPNIDGLLFVCSLDKLASINTCLGIKRHFQQELKSSSHCMLLGIGDDQMPLVESVRIQAHKLRMDVMFIELEHMDRIPSNFDLDGDNQLLDFFISLFQGSTSNESCDDASSNTSSSIHLREKSSFDQMNSSNQHICKTCGQYKSSENFNNVSESSHEAVYQMAFYDQVLGETNEDLFHNCGSELQFSDPIDACSQCTEVKCGLHSTADSTDFIPRSFRTRIRSQSGPDLRSLSDSNKYSLKKSNTSISYCSECGSKISYCNDGSCSRKSFFRSTTDKVGPSKKFSTKLQDIFSPIKRHTDGQSQNQGRSFVRSSFKRHK